MHIFESLIDYSEREPRPDFWIEINYRDGRQIHVPFVGTQEAGLEKINRMIAMDSHQFIDFCLLLSRDYRPGTVATTKQILADSQGYPVPGAKRL